MQHCDSLFHAARILTQDAGRTILEDAALAVRNGRIAAVGLPVLLITLPVICYLVWLFVKLQRLSRRQKWLRNRLMTRNGHPPVRRSRQRRHRKE